MSLPEDVDSLAGLIDTVGVGVGMYGEEGTYLYVNGTYAAMFDSEPDDMVGTPLWEVNPDLDADRFGEYWACFADGETRMADAIHEFNGIRKHVSTVTTRTTAEGTVYHVGTIRDVSPIKQREQQLERLHAVTSDLMEAGDREEIAQITARTAEEILGYESSVVRFAVDGDLCPVAVTDSAREQMGERPIYPVDGDTPAARAFRSGEPQLYDDVSLLADEYERGNVRTVMYVPVGENGLLSVGSREPGAFDQADLYLASILTANTETALTRLANERTLERKNERLEAFYEVISHDIPNHLNVAETRVELAQLQDDLDHLESATTAHRRIEEVIEDMESLVQQGEQIETMERVSIAEAIELCWERCCPEDSEATLVIDDPGEIQADPTRVKQLFENLLWNAFEHAGEAATIRVGGLADGFYVEDDGPGIPADKREEVFTPGYTTAADHSGFGLAIVREIARAHGWSLSITEGSDGGARFEVTGATVR